MVFDDHVTLSVIHQHAVRDFFGRPSSKRLRNGTAHEIEMTGVMEEEVGSGEESRSDVDISDSPFRSEESSLSHGPNHHLLANRKVAKRRRLKGDKNYAYDKLRANTGQSIAKKMRRVGGGRNGREVKPAVPPRVMAPLPPSTNKQKGSELRQKNLSLQSNNSKDRSSKGSDKDGLGSAYDTDTTTVLREKANRKVVENPESLEFDYGHGEITNSTVYRNIIRGVEIDSPMAVDS